MIDQLIEFLTKFSSRKYISFNRDDMGVILRGESGDYQQEMVVPAESKEHPGAVAATPAQTYFLSCAMRMTQDPEHMEDMINWIEKIHLDFTGHHAKRVDKGTMH